MKDLELYIYIGLALIYFLSRAFRKKKPVKPPAPRPGTSTNEDYDNAIPKEKPLTFEDLLREFTGKKNVPVPEDKEELIEIEDDDSIERKYTQEDDQIAEEYETYNEDNYKSYEDVYGNKGNLKTLDEQIQINVPVRNRFDEYKIEVKTNIHVAKRFRELLQNKNSLKDAIILKEILDRKYF